MAKRDLDHFLTRLRDLRWLGQQPDGGRTVMDSSLNQRMGPRDCNYFLRDEVSFATSLVALQEAGCPKKDALAGVNGVEELDYQWTAYWYQAAEAAAGASAPSRGIAD